MRFVILSAALLLSGCATDSAFSGYCSVYEYPGGKADPEGLIRLPPTLEKELHQQLPEEVRGEYVCWYSSGQTLIAGGRRNPTLGNWGYVFTKQAGKWSLADPKPIIFEIPNAIE